MTLLAETSFCWFITDEESVLLADLIRMGFTFFVATAF
jgi:hypothetical protein